MYDFASERKKIHSDVKKLVFLDFFQIPGEKFTDLNMVKCEFLKILKK